jgi:hypothetical protein
MRRLFRLWQIGGQDLRFLLKTLRQPGRPQWLLPALLILMFFAFEPLNFALPLLGRYAIVTIESSPYNDGPAPMSPSWFF